MYSDFFEIYFVLFCIMFYFFRRLVFIFVLCIFVLCFVFLCFVFCVLCFLFFIWCFYFAVNFACDLWNIICIFYCLCQYIRCAETVIVCSNSVLSISIDFVSSVFGARPVGSAAVFFVSAWRRRLRCMQFLRQCHLQSCVCVCTSIIEAKFNQSWRFWRFSGLAVHPFGMNVAAAVHRSSVID